MKQGIFLFMVLLFSTLNIAVANENNSTDALKDLSVIFYDNPTDATYHIGKIDVKKLDFSVESLEEVHKLLDTVDLEKIDDTAYVKLVLRAGAYVGEVYRKKDNQRDWQWLSYEQALAKDKKMASLGESVGTLAVLNHQDSMIFPLAKVQKYLVNGKEDSLRFFVEGMFAMMNQNAKNNATDLENEERNSK